MFRLMLIVVLVFGVVGCAQNAEQWTKQDVQTTPVSEVDSSQLADKYLWVQINQHSERPSDLDKDGSHEPLEIDMDDGEGLSDDHRTYSIGDVSVVITEGGGNALDATGGATGTSNQTANPTQTTTQEVKPEIGISAAFALQGQGVVDHAVSTAASAGTSTVDKEAAHEVFASMLKSSDPDAIKNGLEMLIQVMADLQAAKGEPDATSS